MGPGSAEQRHSASKTRVNALVALHRAPDTATSRPALTLTSLSVPSRPAGTFPDECCFQVIYFVSSIFFPTPVETRPKARVETCWLTRAVKNASANRRFAEICVNFDGSAGLTERKWRN
jgi:hypothetical protein